MKDLTDYFGKAESPNVEPANDKKSNRTCKNEIKAEKMDNHNDIHNGRKKKKKKLKRKPSDPAVKNIVDMLSNNLTIVSPNTSSSSQSQFKSNEVSEIIEDKISITSDEEQENVLLKCEIAQIDTVVTNPDKENYDCSKLKTKVNAFQFMMESRNKSIGQNPPGKDLSCNDDSINEQKESKDVLAARKNLLKNWSEKKGASKRKREEEIEEIISYKLQKRAKRLKKLLQVDDLKDVSCNAVKKTQKRIKRIASSSSENSRNSVLLEEVNETITTPLVEVIEENAQDSVFNQSKAKETKQGLLTFFGVVQKTKKSPVINVESTDEELITKKRERRKLKKKKKIETNSVTNINDDPVKIITDDENSNDSLVVKASKCNRGRKRENIQEKAKTPKTPTQNSKDDDNFTPRSLKSWKMKIKINENCAGKEQVEAKTEDKRPQRIRKITNYSILFQDESSNEGNSTPQRQSKDKGLATDDVICLDDSMDKKKKEPSKPVKVAPVFTKSTPKPKLAPEDVEARRQFLMSGIPDSLKKSIEKQQSIEDREYDVFPLISHIQQKCETQIFWNLPKPELNLKDCSPLKVSRPMIFARVTNSQVTNHVNIQSEVEKVDKLKTLLNKIKSDNPNYPVYKSFRLIYEKSGKTLGNKKAEPKKVKRQSRRSASKDIEIVEGPKPETDYIKHSMWTDKYKPRTSEDIVGNNEGVKNLRKFLEYWRRFSEEINAKKKKRLEYCSDSEFDTTDGDSRDSTKLPGNTVVVGGPCGSGKSTAIYAICNELGFNVIELNASSKRTGKRVLQELQEATQSHQVRKKERNMQNPIHSVEKTETRDQQKKMCVILIEDVDIVFEQDDGFVSALSQLVSSSKRPVVFTTTDTSPIFIQKFISQHEYISFLPLSSQSLATWLQIVCLVEGLFVNQGDIGSLLEFNKGDVRRTLLQLQFWVQSGGQIVRDNLPVKMKTAMVNMDKKFLDDEQEPWLEDSGTQEVFVHSDCIRSFEIFRHHKPYRVPYYINLGLLWWNVPNILGIRSFSEERMRRFRDNPQTSYKETKKETSPQTKKLSLIEKQKLELLSKLYDSLVFTDVSFRAVNYFEGLEPDVKNYSSEVKNSLELNEVMEGYNGHEDFVHEITHDLVNGYVEEFIGVERNESVLNIAVPEKAERRWRAKMHVCEDVFREVLPLSTYVERKSIALDYMPTLRDISRSECLRAATNTKRGNRFRNYLRGLGISYNDNTLKMACNILREDDF